MKRTVFTAAIALMIYGANAQSVMIQGGQDLDRKIYFTQVRVGFPITWKGLELEPYGGWLTYAEWKGKDFTNAAPFQDRYDMGTKLSYRGFFIEYNHFCTHGVRSQSRYRYNGNEWNQSASSIIFGYSSKHAFSLD
ncbi:MAG TPA: hypothetical protein DSN98_09005 [Thermoplasmata archaeon]|nr:MAG TPA: hypothetical protein DSN98_09005 [Thermoplasmata archaeon]